MPVRPSANELERFLLGTLPPADAVRVAEWVTTAPEAPETLRAISAADTFTDSLKIVIRGDRAQLGTAPPNPDQTVTQLEAPAPSAHSPIAFPPAELGGFRVGRELGRGGMGAVFEATDAALGRKVALKVMLPEVAVHPQARARFLREARAAARVEHETIVPIYQVGEANGVPYIAMPLLVGESLDTRLKPGNPLPLADILLIGRQMAEGLAAAHAGGLIHRDIKPSNIWLDLNPNGSVRRIRILDFGLRAPGDAVLTGAGDILGTPAYMSVEQARGQLVDFRTDLYSLGVVLYQAATGRRPFEGGSAYAVLALLAVHVPPAPVQVNPAVPPALSLLIVKLMSKTPAGRPQSARAVIEELARIAAPWCAPVPAAVPGTKTVPALPAVQPPPRPTPVPPPLPSPETVSVAAEPLSTLPDAPDPVPEPEPLSLDAEFSVEGDVTELFQPEPAAPPRRPRRGLLIAVGAVAVVGLLVAVVLAFGSGKKEPSVQPSPTNPDPEPPKPKLERKELINENFARALKAERPVPDGWSGDAFRVTKDLRDRPCLEVTPQTEDHFVTLRPPDEISGNFVIEGEYFLGRPDYTRNGHKFALELESSKTRAKLSVAIGWQGHVFFDLDPPRDPTQKFKNTATQEVQFSIARDAKKLTVKLNTELIAAKDLKSSAELGAFDTVRIGLPGELGNGTHAKLYSLIITALPN